MKHEILLPNYLQQHEISQNQLTCFTPNTAESFHMTMNSFLMGRSSIKSNKPLGQE